MDAALRAMGQGSGFHWQFITVYGGAFLQLREDRGVASNNSAGDRLPRCVNENPIKSYKENASMILNILVPY